VEEIIPLFLGDLIEQVGDEWDGSPFLVLAIPEHPELDAFILTAESGAERMTDMREAVRASIELPVAAAYVVSSPLFTTTGLAPGEGLLSIFCAHADGREAVTFITCFVHGTKLAASSRPRKVWLCGPLGALVQTLSA
jgi:hypothetical protein